MIIILPLPIPINQMYKTGGGHFYKDSKVKDWEKEAGIAILSQKVRKMRLGALYCGIDWFLARDRDIDSGLKSVLDLLQRQRIIVNDSMIEHLNVKKYKDKARPRVEIELRNL